MQRYLNQDHYYSSLLLNSARSEYHNLARSMGTTPHHLPVVSFCPFMKSCKHSILVNIPPNRPASQIAKTWFTSSLLRHRRAS